MAKHSLGKTMAATAMAIMACSGANAQECIDGNCEDGYGIYVYDNGDRYDGYWKDGRKDGFGIYIYNNGDIYVGQYLNDELNGKGTFSWADDGTQYIGHWQNNNRQGIGKYVQADGTVTSGIFSNDEMVEDGTKVEGCINGTCESGFGVCIYRDGSQYEGMWSGGYPNGQGSMTDKEGGVYKGEFLNGYYNGFGTYTAPDGTKKEGLWEEDRYLGEVNVGNISGDVSGNTTNGYGFYVFDNGNYYIGNWKDDKTHGLGEMISPDGSSYRGCWENGQMNGQGKYTYADNDENGRWFYTGDIRNGVREGFGALIWKDNSVYYGQFKNDTPNGQGVLVDYGNEGRILCGIWDDGKMVSEMDEQKFDLIYGSRDGFGIKLVQDGRYAGNLRNGMPDGQGMLRCFSGCTIVGNCFKNGKIDGEGMMELPDGRRYVGHIAGTAAHGNGTIYQTDGSTFTGKFQDGELVEETTEMVAKPQVSWTAPQIYNTETTDGKAKVELCITSETPISSITLYVNGVAKAKPVPVSRGFKVVTSKCDYSYTFDIELQPGKNELMAEVKNSGGTTKSDIRTITLTKSDKVSSEKRLALVIGNADYKNTISLPNPGNDATLMGKTLEQMGFETMVFTNIGNEQMKRAIKDFGARLKETQAVGLFFYAGHGFQVNGENFLVPVDADVQKTQDMEFECVNLQRLLGEMDYAGNDLNIVILDACRNNPFAKTRSINDGGLAAVNAPKGTFIAFSTAPGSVASDGEGSNGLYTSQLVKHIQKPGMILEEVFKNTRNDVYNISDKQQVPWENSSIFGDFYFTKPQ